MPSNEKQREVTGPPAVGEVVGENLRRLRQERRWTQDAAAREFAAVGLRWKRTHIAALESGRRETVDVGTLVLLAAAFEVPVPELYQGSGDVLLTPRAGAEDHGVTATREQLRAWMSGEHSNLMIRGPQTAFAVLELSDHKTRPIPVEADRALAKRLGRNLRDVVNAAEGLWGRSLTEERDRRVAAELADLPIGERQARQGHITRELSAALRKWIEGGEAEADG
ncbi:helix-turn-helix transcriptional regulator [Streptomyces sp. NPDC001508]|uniref:helix-turn-helix domain-containing protein n=1 Tax=Streptomyces sp. NPDC001508 TaxID=3154656 RepID=UPI00332BF31C